MSEEQVRTMPETPVDTPSTPPAVIPDETPHVEPTAGATPPMVWS